MSEYNIDEEKLQDAIVAIPSTHREIFNEALSKGWKPDFQKAIGEWHTACIELRVGHEYVKHILEEHPEDDAIWRIEDTLKEQALDFLAELHDSQLEEQEEND